MADVPVDSAVKRAKVARKLSDVETEVLISEVQSRPCLWNDSHNDFKNTVVTRKLWSEVGAAVDLSGEEVKSKWKNLKDKFRKILQTPPPKSGSAAKPNTTKWKFYNTMMFCKDVVLPSRMIGNLTPTFDVEETSSESNAVVADLWEEEEANVDEPLGTTQGNPPSLQQQARSSAPVGGNNLRFSRPHRAKSAGIKKQNMETKLMKLEEKKVEAILQLQNKPDQGDDYHFFMSLMPFVKVLDPLEKLQVRSSIQSAVVEAYKAHEARNRQQVFSRPSSSITSSPASYSGQPVMIVNQATGEFMEDVGGIGAVGNAFLHFNEPRNRYD